MKMEWHESDGEPLVCRPSRYHGGYQDSKTRQGRLTTAPLFHSRSETRLVIGITLRARSGSASVLSFPTTTEKS